jgi:hypothetical protein
VRGAIDAMNTPGIPAIVCIKRSGVRLAGSDGAPHW